MTYTKPGYDEIPSGQLVPKLCDKIKSSETTWQNDVATVISKLGRAARRVKDLTIEDVVALAGVDSFKQGSEQLRALQHVLLRFLHSLGVVSSYPAVVGYRRSPKLTLDEILDRMPEIAFPTLDALGGEAGFTIEVLKAVFPTMIRELAARQRMRDVYKDRLRRKLSDIAFKIATGRPIDQAERSFYVHFANADVAYALTTEELTGLALGRASAFKIPIAENGDPLVTAAWERFKAVTEPGPWLRFNQLISNRSFERLQMWVGPMQSVLSYPIGYRMKYGTFSEFRTQQAFSVPWTREGQLTASRERVHTSVRMGGALATGVPILATVLTGLEPVPSFDLPGVDIRVDLDGNDAAPVEFAYRSSWRNRRVSSAQGFDASDLLVDLALANETLGESLSTGKSLDSFPLVDLELSIAEKHLPEANQPITLTKEMWQANIFIASRKVQGQIDHHVVDMRPFYQRMGTTILPPAFREYMMCPMSVLYDVDADAERYAMARMALTHEDMLVAERSVRICLNYSRLKRLLPDPRQLPVDEDRLVALVKAVSGLPSTAAINKV